MSNSQSLNSYWINEWWTSLWASQVVLVVKNLPANAGDVRDTSSIPESGRSPGEGNGNPPQCSCLENPRDGGAWCAAAYGVAQSRTRLKRLSSSSSSSTSLWASQVVLVVKNLPANAGDVRDTSSIPESGRSPGEGNGNPHQYSHPGESHRSLAGYSPQGRKEMDTTEVT